MKFVILALFIAGGKTNICLLKTLKNVQPFSLAPKLWKWNEQEYFSHFSHWYALQLMNPSRHIIYHCVCMCVVLKQPTVVGSPPINLSPQGWWVELMLNLTAGHGRYCVYYTVKNDDYIFFKFIVVHFTRKYFGHSTYKLFNSLYYLQLKKKKIVVSKVVLLKEVSFVFLSPQPMAPLMISCSRLCSLLWTTLPALGLTGGATLWLWYSTFPVDKFKTYSDI